MLDETVRTPNDIPILNEAIKTPDVVREEPAPHPLTGTNRDETGEGENMATES